MTNVKAYTDKQLLDKVKSLSSFNHIPNDYWLLAIRSDEDAFNEFDDKIYLFKGEEFILVTSCTTNPGGPALLGGFKKYNKNGAAIIKSNEWYYDTFKYGLHNGKMPALRQVKSMLYYRDKDLDKKAEEEGTIESAIYNTNIHFNSYSVFDKVKLSIKQYIGEWSYGCIVLNEQEKYKKIIELTKPQIRTSFVLLKEF